MLLVSFRSFRVFLMLVLYFPCIFSSSASFDPFIICGLFIFQIFCPLLCAFSFTLTQFVDIKVLHGDFLNTSSTDPSYSKVRQWSCLCANNVGFYMALREHSSKQLRFSLLRSIQTLKSQFIRVATLNYNKLLY